MDLMPFQVEIVMRLIESQVGKGVERWLQDAAGYPMTLRYRIDGTGTTYNAPLTTQADYTDKVAFGSSVLEGAHSVEVWVEDDHGATSPHRTG